MRKLPVNLATHPIEQRRWVRRVTLTAAAVVVGVTLLHALLVWSLLDDPEPVTPDAEAIALLREWSEEAAELISSADPRSARRVALAVGLANALIDQRALDWGGLFTMLEESLPDNVRLEVIQPVATATGLRVSMTAASQSTEALRAFLANLDARPEFVAVYPGRQVMGTDLMIRLSFETLVADRVGAVGGDAGPREPSPDEGPRERLPDEGPREPSSDEGPREPSP